MKLKSDYIFLPAPEIVRAAGLAILVAIAQVAIKLDWSILDNWQTYAVSLVAAAVLALFQFILGQAPPANPDSPKAIMRQVDTAPSMFAAPMIIKGVKPVSHVTNVRRFTLCDHDVDLSDDTQRSRHTLREAPFCGRCTGKWIRNPQLAVTIGFTEEGKRRHLSQAVEMVNFSTERTH